MPGTFVSLPAKLNLLMNGYFKPTGIIPALGTVLVTANYMVNLTGDFNIYFIRGEDQKITVQLVSRKSRSRDKTVSLLIAPVQVQLLSLVNGFVQYLMSNSVTVGFSERAEDEFMIEYNFDLSQSSAQVAYNELLNPRKVFKSYRESDPLTLVSDLSALNGVKGVDISFKGQRHFSKEEESLKFKIIGGSFKTSKAESDEILTYSTDKRNVELRYYSFDSSQESKSWIPIFRSTKNIQTFALLDTTDRSQSPLIPIEASGVNLEFTQEALFKGDLDKLFGQLKNELPPTIFENLQSHRTEIKYGKDYRNVKIAMQIYYKQSLMHSFTEIKNEAEFIRIRDIAWEKIKNIPGSARIITGNDPLQLGIATSLVNALCPNFDHYGALDGSRKAIDFLSLRNDRTVRDIGFSAILNAVLGEKNVSDGMYYSFWWSAVNPAEEEENVALSAGIDSDKELYESLKFAKNMFSGPDSKLEFYFP